MERNIRHAFRVQMISYATGQASLELLRYYGAPMQETPPHTIRAICDSAGERSSVRGRDAHEIIEKLKRRHFNQLLLRFETKLPRSLSCGAKLTHMDLLMEISPTSELWQAVPVVSNLRLSRNANNSRRTFQNQQFNIAYHGIKRFPVVYTMAVAFVPDASYDRATIIEGFVSALGDLHLSHPITGSLDIGNAWLSLPVLKAITPRQKNCEVLDTHFDDLHNALFGSMAICEPLAEAIGPPASLRQLPPFGGEPMGFIVIEESAIRDAGVLKRATPWLVEK